MNALFTIIVSAIAIGCCTDVFAQISSPPPMAGAVGAGHAATHYAMMNKYTNGTSYLCEERTKWKAHMIKRSECRRGALDVPAGKRRTAIRDQCEAMYPMTKAPRC
jgi:hypothetical protein